MKTKILFILLLFICIGPGANAQENEADEKESAKGNHRLSLGIGHTHVAESLREGQKEWQAFASWSLNYDFWLSGKWAIGIENDLIMESFLIENTEEETIERNYPVAIVPVTIFKPFKHFSFLGGVGMELSPEEHMGMVRIGAECGFELPGKFELSAGFVFDERWNNYNSWAFTVTLSKLFSRHHK